MSNLVEVRILRQGNGTYFVEWTDDAGVLQRATVTEAMVVRTQGNTATVDAPHRGVPYGAPLGTLWDPVCVGMDIDRELRRRGIWTTADLRANPVEARAALLAAFGANLQQLLNAAKRYDQLTEG